AASGYSYMPRLISFMQKRLASVSFILKEMVTGEQVEALNTGRVDIGLMRFAAQHPELASRPVMTERFVVCSPAGIPPSARPVRLQDFDQQPFIMYAPDKARYFHDLLAGL